MRWKQLPHKKNQKIDDMDPAGAAADSQGYKAGGWLAARGPRFVSQPQRVLLVAPDRAANANPSQLVEFTRASRWAEREKSYCVNSEHHFLAIAMLCFRYVSK